MHIIYLQVIHFCIYILNLTFFIKIVKNKNNRKKYHFWSPYFNQKRSCTTRCTYVLYINNFIFFKPLIFELERVRRHNFAKTLFSYKV